MWTKFFDMSSGGSEKLDAGVIWIEASEDEAIPIFEQIFDRDPYNVTCACCGSDYSVYETDFEPNNGDWIVSRRDIERFRNGAR